MTKDALYMVARPSEALELFDNPNPERDYEINITIPEFTCLCPKTGQPDFATLELTYVPDRRCVELKALKLYIGSFRDQGTFHEAVTNQIVDHIVNACAPRYLRLCGRFNVRGGLYTTVTVGHQKPGWKPTNTLRLNNSNTPHPYAFHA